MPKKKKEKSSETMIPVIEEVVVGNIIEQVDEQQDKHLKEPVLVEKRGFDFKLLLFMTVITAIVTGLLAGGFYVYFTGISKLDPVGEEKTNYPTPVTVATPEPQSSPSVVDENVAEDESIDVSLYKIQILNGSGKIGEASKAEKILIAADYEVVNVGNASSYNYKQTVVAYKKDVPPIVITNLKDLLSKAYDVAEKDGDNLTSGSYDIVITVGSQ